MYKMYNGIFIFITLLILLSGCTSVNKSNNVSNGKPESSEFINYNIGRNPNMFIMNSKGDTIYYKSFVTVNNERLYQGLYSKKIDGKGRKLLYNDFEGFLNVYNDLLYFTDTKGQLVELNMTSLKANIIDGNDKYHIYGPLVISDILFYNRIDNNDKCALIAYYIKEKKAIEVAQDIYWRFLSNYKDNICFLDKNRNINLWNATSKEITSYGFFDMEILQMLNDGSVIGYKNKSYIRSLNGETSVLFEIENMFNSIIIDNCIYVSTVDKHNYTQIFRYSLKTSKLDKIASVDFPLIGYCGKYLFCSSDSGMGDLLIVNTDNGEIKTFDDRFN
ncbi:hypothetical protein SAMN05443428_105176 [Caloramator quimbayensis]|uniref:DUF5050 domain-containing protein n=1 Tax=Caloramator quimbayensis TaxID=1147123 RepID=A0A1T4X3U9_9CLOT|nr:hypothetical protein [Caloramator quimbayensis]SKA83808.1 hypothetical protein SAMN05443428_105176 [Caloramator quimbayensis]